MVASISSLKTVPHTHGYLRGHCCFVSERATVDWKSRTLDICTSYFLKYPCVSSRADYLIEIDESGLKGSIIEDDK